ncbi:MAG: hypothetical protein ACKVT0_18460 [Planctomycetaceae bacterium]
MNCLEFRNRLLSAVESQQPVDTELLAEHSRSCSSCEREWQRHQILSQAIGVWNDAVPSVDLADVVVSRWLVEAPGPISFEIPSTSPVLQESETNPSVDRAETSTAEPNVLVIPHSSTSYTSQPNRSRAREVLWIPASLLTLFLILVWNTDNSQLPSTKTFTTRPRNDAKSNPVAKTTVDANETGGTAPLPQLDALIDDMEIGYRELAQSAVITISDAALLSPANENRSFWPSMIMFAPELDGENQPLPETRTTSPVSQGFSKALDLLLEVVPAMESPTS